MFSSSLRSLLAAGIAVAVCGLAFNVQAGGSGLNTVVVINQASSNSCAAGNYFCERRQVPPGNVLFITWPGSNMSWTNSDFQNYLLNPLLAMLSARQLTNQIDYIVLSMDIPYQTINGPTVNSTTSGLFYGLKDDSGANSAGVTNSYAASEQIFRQAPPASAQGYSFLATMITADSVALAKQLIDQGVNSDGTSPAQPVVLAKSSDILRNIRYHNFDNAIFNTRLCQSYSVERTNLDSLLGLTNMLGFETGLANFSISPGAFVPGAMADSLTSFGGELFNNTGQTTLLAFIAAGAAGSYGTVVEPSPDPTKFPNPEVYFYQARGFNIAESYYQSVAAPYEGLIVAEPLAAPFGHSGSGSWLGVASNAVLSGSTRLSLQFTAADSSHPLQQVDLFIDGMFAQTLTNLPPLPGNTLTVTLNGVPLTCTVPTNSSIATVASALAAQIGAASSATNILATSFGDRVELHAVSANRPAPPASFRRQTSTSGGSTTSANSAPPALLTSAKGSAGMLTTLPGVPRNMFLNSQAFGIKTCYVNGSLQVGTWLQLNVTKTNGLLISIAVTNQSPTAMPLDLATQLVNLINTNTALQGPDGLVVQDLAQGLFNSATFNLYARSPGHKAALMTITLTGSSLLTLTPTGSVNLTDNLSDLQGRNHLYIRAGATNLSFAFPLDTTALPDGYHELAAVAYEGTDVRTQTRATLPVVVQNSALNAVMTLIDLPDPSPAQGTYHIQVTANTNNVSAISLFTTGGLYATLNNQSKATFTVNGAGLGAGLHPFYALVQTSSGAQYRTATSSVHLY